MNSTHWVTLTTFVQYLGKTGKCRVDKAERDWYVDFIDRDPKTLKRQAAEERNSKLDKNFEDQSLATIEAQVARANEDHESSSETEEEKEFKREDGQKLGFNLKTTPNDERAVVPSVLGKRKKSSGDGKKVKKEKSDHRESAENDEHRNGERKNRWGEKPLLQPIKAVKKKQKLSDLAMLAKEIEHGKNMTGFSSNPFSSTQRSVKSEKSKSRTKKSSRRSGGHSPSEPHKKMQKTEKKAEKRWIREGIIVKLMNKKFQDGKYYKQKGTITSISEKFLAIVELKDGTVVKFDQRMLETVLPALGKPVAILLGEHKGKTGVLKRIREKDFKAEVDVTLVGRILVPYDYICKVAKNFKK